MGQIKQKKLQRSGILRTLSPLVIGALTLVSIVSGCGPALTSSYDFSRAISQQIGIPVHLWAYPGDFCVERQLRAFVDDAGHMNASQRVAFLAEIRRRYQAIVINASESLGELHGGIIQLLPPLESRGLSDRRLASTLRTENGRLPGTFVNQNASTELGGRQVDRVLEITSYFVTQDHSSITQFRALNLAAFHSVRVGAPPEGGSFPFGRGVEYLRTFPSRQVYSACGPVVHLSDLIREAR